MNTNAKILSILLMGFLLANASLAVGISFPVSTPIAQDREGPAVTPERSPVKVSPSIIQQLAKDRPDKLSVLIRTVDHDYSGLKQQIERVNGKVTQEFKYATGIAAEVPSDALFAISSNPSVVAVYDDVARVPDAMGSDPLAQASAGQLSMEELDTVLQSEAAFLPDGTPFETTTIPLNELEAILKDITPSTYANPLTMDAGGVWATGNFGQDSLAVIIDTGVYGDHFMLQGSLIGGIDMSTDVGTPYEGYSRPDNHYHGSHVAGILAGHGAIVIPEDSLLAQSIILYGGVVIPYAPGYVMIPLLGMAPMAQLFAIKVFPHTGAGASESTIIAAIEYAVDMKVNQGIDVDIISMSLGGPSGYEGADLEAQAVDAAKAAGITVVASAGNSGPASMTGGSPGAAPSSISVGAVAHPINTRVFWDQYFGFLGIGNYLFVGDQPQIIYFSSRGPTSDGRTNPTISAVGVFVLSAFPSASNPNGIAFASGTSMSAPAASGAVALLNTLGEQFGATPNDYEQALIDGATWLNGYDENDQGAGLINATASMYSLLSSLNNNDDDHGMKDRHHDDDDDDHGMKGHHHDDDDEMEARKAAKPKGIDTGIKGKGTFTYSIQDLAPGEVMHFYLKVKDSTSKITVEISNVQLGANLLGIDSFEVSIQSAIRSTDGYYTYSTNVYGDAYFEITDLSTIVSGNVFGASAFAMPIQPGYVKVVIENDWTSSDFISGDITITAEKTHSPEADEEYEGDITDGDLFMYDVGFGPNGVLLELNWENNWERYPASDLDMIVIFTDIYGNTYFDPSGATLSSPEMIILPFTDLASVTVYIIGYATYGFVDEFELEVWYL